MPRSLEEYELLGTSFVDLDDATIAPMAAALLVHYAGGRVQVSSAGLAPAETVAAAMVQVMADAGLDTSDAFCKPLTDDAVRAADLVVLLGDLPADLGMAGQAPAARIRRWDIAAIHDASQDLLRTVRDDLDRRVLHLLADLLTSPTA